MRATLVDVSRHQGVIDGKAIKDAGFDGIVARCTIGVSYADPFYINNFKEAHSNGLIKGAYHVLWPANQDPKREARWFRDRRKVDGLEPDLGVGDIELMHSLSASNVYNQAEVLMGEMELLTSLLIVTYTGSWFWNGSSHLGPATPGGLEDDHGLWEAEYLKLPSGQTHWRPDQAPQDKEPLPLGDGWNDWKLWQWTSKGEPVGIQGKVLDYSVFNGTLDELKAFLGLAPIQKHVIEDTWPAETEVIEITLRRT